MVVLYLAIHFINGARKGVLSILINMVGFIASLVVAFYTYSYSAEFIAGNFSLDRSYANILGFFANIFIAKLVISVVIFSLMPKAVSNVNNSFVSRMIGGLVSFSYGFFITFLLFSITLSFSLPYFMSNEVSSSVFGSFVARDPLKLNNSLKGIFGDVLKTTISKLDFLTIGDQEHEKIDFKFKASDVKISEKDEIGMLGLINNERKSRGLPELVVDEKLRGAARLHGEDMFKGGYFSHLNLEGKQPSDRMKDAGAEFNFSGENLAYSKDLLSAHEGLMKSPGHKANILNQFYHRVGIGVIDGGPYGMIFVQNFAD